MAFTSLAGMVRRYESGSEQGNYTARSNRSTASGAYQYLDSTWRNDARGAGYDTSQYPTAASAPPAVQDSVFQYTVQRRGLSDWTCPGCNPQLTSYLAQNPSARSLPAAEGPYDSSSGFNTASSGATTSAYQTVEPRDLEPDEPGYDPNNPRSTNLSRSDWARFQQEGSTPGETGDTGSQAGGSSTPNTSSRSGTSSGAGSSATAMETAGQAANAATFAASEFQLGLNPSPGALTAATGWVHDFDASITAAIQGAVTSALTWAFGSTENWFLRWGLILAGLVLVALALWAIMSKASDGAVPSPGVTAKTGARMAFA